IFRRRPVRRSPRHRQVSRGLSCQFRHALAKCSHILTNVRSAKDGCSGNKNVGTGGNGERRGLRVNPAVDLDQILEAEFLAQQNQLAHFVKRVRNQFPSTEAGFDCHHKNKVGEFKQRLDCAHRCVRFYRYSGVTILATDFPEEIGAAFSDSFIMKSDVLSARLDEFLVVVMRVADHEMTVKVKRLIDLADAFDESRAEADVRHETTIYDVKVKP